MNSTTPDLQRARRASLAIGGASGVACLVAGVFGSAPVLQSWLSAWLFCLGIALGAMANVMIHELTGGAWGFAIRRPLEAAVGTLPALALLALPLALGLPGIFPWAGRDAGTGAALLAHKHWYLNLTFFALRAAVYFGVWIGLGAALRRHWRRRETNAGERADAALRALSIVGLLAYAFTASLAAVDWMMSLSADWYSTSFGLLVMVGQSLAGFVFSVAVAVAIGDLQRAADHVGRIAQDLGNILLTYAMLWAYLAFTQFLIIWAEDLPHEISWYVERSTPLWKAVAIVVLAMQFAVPFLAMLFRRFKRDPARLAWLCLAVLGAHALEVVWLTLPSMRGAATPLNAFDLIAVVAVCGLWLSAFLTTYAATPTMHAPAEPAAAAG